ncbi:unnamed protein product, partial [Cuscuta epithymum]
MSNREVHLRLCSLIRDSLCPYAELLPTSFTKENVKDLLIALSRVCSQIKLWKLDFPSDSDSDSDVAGGSPGVMDCSVIHRSDTEIHPCLSKAISVLMELLDIENSYVQHLVGNILVETSNFLVASGSSWFELKQLFSLLDMSIFSSTSSSTGCIMVEVNPSTSVSPVKLHHKSNNWVSIAVITQVLRRIVKNAKRDADDHILKLCFEATNSLISNVPWDLLHEIFVCQTNKSLGDLNADGLFQCQDAKPKPAILFLGSFIQLLCSLAEMISLPLEAITDDLHKHTVISEIRSILPRLLGLCHGNFQNFGSLYISKYYKHKFLILMIRLSSGVQLDGSVLHSWLNLIHLYFQDILCLPIAGVESDLDKCLEGSPFWENTYDAEKENMTSRHLQRLAIFLFLRCSFCMVNMERSGQNRAFTDHDCHSAVNLKSDLSKGLKEIHEWLQLVSNDDAFLDHKKCAECILSFQLCFLQLYMHEDDILFQMLLQLLCISPLSEEWFVKEGMPSADVKMASIVSDLFNPICVFHHFLAEISYDHQVLLDYLISKDTGASSAEYLLRCLRMVFQSWSLFQTFPWSIKNEIQLCQKRRKTSVDRPSFSGELSTSVNDGICFPFELDHQMRGKHYGAVADRTERVPFECASSCLLELKASIESLHQKNLFPYNPQVLLQRLSRFQELYQ